MHTREEIEKSCYTGIVFECELYIGYFYNGKPETDLIEPVYYFEDEGERDLFVEHILQTEGTEICDLEDGQWLQVNFKEYPVEDGWINYDLGIRHSSHVLVDRGVD